MADAGQPWGKREVEPRPLQRFNFARDVPYRLFRLRRVWIASNLIPLIASILARGSAVGWDEAMSFPALWVGSLFAWAIISAAWIVAFPVLAVIEVMSAACGIVAGIAIVAFSKPVSGGLFLLLVIPWAVASVAAAMLAASLARYLPAYKSEIRHSFRLTVPAEKAFDRLSLKPGGTWPGIVSDYAAPDGTIEMRIARWIFDAENGSYKPLVNTAVARILEERPLAQVTAVRPLEGDHAPTLVTVAVEEAPGGCVFHHDQICERLAFSYHFIEWMTDGTRDALTARIDDLEGRPARAISTLPIVGLTIRLAALLPRGDTPPGRQGE